MQYNAASPGLQEYKICDSKCVCFDKCCPTIMCPVRSCVLDLAVDSIPGIALHCCAPFILNAIVPFYECLLIQFNLDLRKLKNPSHDPIYEQNTRLTIYHKWHIYFARSFNSNSEFST